MQSKQIRGFTAWTARPTYCWTWSMRVLINCHHGSHRPQLECRQRFQSTSSPPSIKRLTCQTCIQWSELRSRLATAFKAATRSTKAPSYSTTTKSYSRSRYSRDPMANSCLKNSTWTESSTTDRRSRSIRSSWDSHRMMTLKGCLGRICRSTLTTKSTNSHS